MKTLTLILTATLALAAHADLDAATAKQLIEKRQAQIGQSFTAKVESIEALAVLDGAQLYRVTADLGDGEQTYQIRQRPGAAVGISDVILTENEHAQAEMASEYRITETDLAIKTQLASDAVVAAVAKDFPDSKWTGVFTFANGERYGDRPAIIFTVQVMYKKMSVPLLRRAYVVRATNEVEIKYED